MAFKISPDDLDQLDAEHALAVLGLHPKQEEAKQTVAAALGHPLPATAPAEGQSGLNAPETPNGVSVAAPAAIGAQGVTPASPAIGIKPQADHPEAANSLKAAVAAPGMGGSAMPAVAAPKTQRQMDEGELQRLTSTGSGVHQIKNPFLHGLAKVGDVALSALFPSVASVIPGTEFHHDVLVNQQRHAVAADIGNEERDAQTKETNARADAADNKVQGTWGLLQDKNGKVIGFHDDKGGMHSLDSPDVPAELKKIGAAAGEKDRNTQFLETDQGIFKVGEDGTLTPATAGGKALQKPQKPDEKAKDIADWLESNKLPDTAENREKARGEIAKRNPQARVDVSGLGGDWQMAEGDNGETVLYNAKTGETKAAPAGVHPKGTKAANDKAEGPQQAIQYAKDYRDKGVFTGPGDEALMEKFFELAKPSSGFRMTQAQIEMLQNARGWMNSVQAKVRHATVGTWFADDQRQEIVDTMTMLENARKPKNDGQSKQKDSKHPDFVPD